MNLYDDVYVSLLTEAVDKRKVVDAIKNKQEIVIYYEGDKTINRGYRTIEPYCIGYTTAGNMAVRAWQLGGASDTKDGKPNDPLSKIPGWRLFRIDKIMSVNTTNKNFNVERNYLSSNRPKYNPNDSDLNNIILSVHPDEVVKQSPRETNSGTGGGFFKNILNKYKTFFKS